MQWKNIIFENVQNKNKHIKFHDKLFCTAEQAHIQPNVMWGTNLRHFPNKHLKILSHCLADKNWLQLKQITSWGSQRRQLSSQIQAKQEQIIKQTNLGLINKSTTYP